MKISEAIDSIQKRDIVLPEFQREYVWTREQAKQLIVSLARGYPVGGILLRKTDQPPELKNIDKLPGTIGTFLVLLDGQQRLTTLHLLLTGQPPTYYTPAEITNDPRGLYVNIGSRSITAADFQYYQASKMKDDPAWLGVVECFTSPKINVFAIAKAKTNGDPDSLFFYPNIERQS